MSDNQILDITINGRLFPLWIMKNFKKYKLSKIIKNPKDDPCITKNVDQNYKELRLYQLFASEYLDYKSPFKNIIIYHGLGSGKTATAINIYNILYNYTPNWNVFILIKASLHDQPWITDLNTYLSNNNNEKSSKWKNIKFIHYDAPRADRIFLDAVKDVDSNNKNIYIFDEVHNFIKNVYNNITNKKGKRAYTIYDYIIQEKKDNDTSRVILLSATPVVNSPYELALIFNLLRPNIFPSTEAKFNELYIVNNKQLGNINMFQRRILGLVSYYYGYTSDLYASQKTIQKNLIMSKYQLEIYKFYEDIEKKLEQNKKSDSSIYRAYTRQASNFVFPVMGGTYTGENRPRPSKFKLSEKEAEKLLETDKVIEDRYKLYLDTMANYISKFDKYLRKCEEEDKKNNYTLKDDIRKFKNEYKYKFTEFVKSDEKKSILFNELYKCSCKMTAILFYVLKSLGSVLVYSNYVKMEGLEIFKIYMKYFGYYDYNKTSKDHYNYTEFAGSLDRETRKKNLRAFNSIDNIDGKNIKIILISPAGSEGISLRNVRQVHIMEPYWNEVRIQQLIGRAIRACSHKDLPIDQRSVVVYRYNAIRDDDINTKDQEIQELAYDKNNLISSFLNAVKEAAIDCNLFKNHNMISEQYKCFQFNEQSYFDKYVGPAFKYEYDYDKKINNGLNSVSSIVKEIEVIKIKGVQKNKVGYSIVEDYWYNIDSGVVYDIEMEYPIGKVYKIDDIPEKLDKDTYIIGDIIAIP
jgi:superfamily II DNA or RNA helicase